VAPRTDPSLGFALVNQRELSWLCVCLPFLLCVYGPVLGPSGGLLTLKGLASEDDVLIIRDKPPFQVRVPRPKNDEKPKKPFFGSPFWPLLALFWPFFPSMSAYILEFSSLRAR
jgi:hypothetical protein